MTQQAYDVFSERRRLESAGVPAAQAEAILGSVGRAATVNEKWKRKLDHVHSSVSKLESDMATLKADMAMLKADVATLKADVAVLKRQMNETATTKDVEAAFAILRADIYRALWAQSLALGTLILGLAVLVATVAVF